MGKCTICQTETIHARRVPMGVGFSTMVTMCVDCDPDAGHALDAAQPATQEATMDANVLTPKVLNDVLELVRDNQTIAAIKLVREHTECSLNEARHYLNTYCGTKMQIYHPPYNYVSAMETPAPESPDATIANLQAENEKLQAQVEEWKRSYQEASRRADENEDACKKLQVKLNNWQRVNSAQADEMVQAREWSTHLETKIRKLHHAVNLADTSRNEASLLTRMWNILNDIEEQD